MAILCLSACIQFACIRFVFILSVEDQIGLSFAARSLARRVFLFRVSAVVMPIGSRRNALLAVRTVMAGAIQPACMHALCAHAQIYKTKV